MTLCSIHPKLLSSIIGGVLFHISLGSIIPLGMLSIYIISYYQEFNTNITVNYGFFFMPVILFTLTIFVPLGGIIDAKLGIHV